jgi:protein TonB
MRRSIRSLVPRLVHRPGRLAQSRLPLALLCASSLLLAACASPRAAATRSAPTATATARNTAPALPPSAAQGVTGYRLTTAQHLYGRNHTRIYTGPMPHYLHAVGVLEMGVDAQGQVQVLRWLRAPSHAPEVMAEIERLVHQAAPYPAPAPSALQNGTARVIETWLWDRSGRFQLRALSEGQGEIAPATRVAAPEAAPRTGAAASSTPAIKQPIGQPVRVHVVAADGR